MGTPAAAPVSEATIAARRRAVSFLLPGLLLAVLAMMMLEQSGRWLLTATNRAGFVRDEFEITNLRDQPGRGGFGWSGQVVSTGERVAGRLTIVSLERLRELDAAGAIPGAREPVFYLPPRTPWTALDYVLAFRVQSPDDFETDASGWAIVNLVFAAGAAWLIGKTVGVARGAGPRKPSRGKPGQTTS